ncbi:MAG TPA: FadR/GntR family transcriptional regulator [Devosia sp.]|nr:FadR/GntR family transcriptional regulator [Devosia sp.]
MSGRQHPHNYRASAPARSQTARVVEDLGLSIVSGKQAQGSLLPGDSELLKRYGVSRTVLREALKMLAGKGLVQAKARIGTRVRNRDTWNLFDPDVLVWHARTGFGPEFLAHLGEMRLALEPDAAALAATRRTDEQLELMQEAAARLGKADISHQEFVNADLALHLTIAAAAHNPFFLSISTLIEVALVAMMSIASPVSDPPRLRRSVADHKAIVNAIAAGNAERARRAMLVVVQEGIDGARGGSIRAPAPALDPAVPQSGLA